MKRKHFIWMFLAVCGIALIAEVVLLVHTFTKKKSPEKKTETEEEKENPAPAEEEEFVWLLTRRIKTDHGEQCENDSIGYDEYGRMIRYESAPSDGISTVATITYEKSGIKAETEGGARKEILLARGFDLLRGESFFRIPVGKYEIEYDEKGFWKSAYYQILRDESHVICGRDFQFDEEGRLIGYEDWEEDEQPGSHLVTGTFRFEYDDSGRIASYSYSRNPQLSFVDPKVGDYQLEYGEDYQRLIQMQSGRKTYERDRRQYASGTFETETKYYKEGDITVWKTWIFRMPGNFNEVMDPIFIAGSADSTEDSIRLEFDSENRFTAMHETGDKGKTFLYTAEYDEEGRLRMLSSGGSTHIRTFTYDDFGNVILMTQTDVDGMELTTQYEWTKMPVTKK